MREKVIKLAREQLQTLTEPMYYVLLALSQPMHGYEIMRTVNEMTGGRLKVGAGTLYALLARFEADGIALLVGEEGRRKTYTLSDKGRALLDREYARLKELVAAYIKRLLIKPE